ncbi:MAG: 50S ribosomal protein L5 [Thaumarchaeota archaeon]|nr:50S ribosomal protein L5 [Nitrososphaerota archaeon]
MSQTVQQSAMRTIRVGKVVINIGLGKSGEAIERGKKVLEQITKQKASQRRAKRAIRDFGVHEGEPIGVLVTVRGKETTDLISRLLVAREKKLQSSCFDGRGSISFGIKEHIEIPGIRYDPAIGILGMNVSVVLERPGYRVTRRLRRTAKVGHRHIINKEEAIEFFRAKFGAVVE